MMDTETALPENDLPAPRASDEWRLGWRMWSVRFHAAATMFFMWLTNFPEQAYGLWSAMPSELRDFFPWKWMSGIGLALFALGLVSRFVKQRKVENARVELTAELAAKRAPQP